jgi:hypothetical protein
VLNTSSHHRFIFCHNKCFIASSLPEFASIDLTLKQKRKLMPRSDEALICIGNLKKDCIFP